jgi:hypothetical protein
VMEQGTFLPLRAAQVAQALARLPASNHCSLASSSSTSAAVSGK